MLSVEICRWLRPVAFQTRTDEPTVVTCFDHLRLMGIAVSLLVEAFLERVDQEYPTHLKIWDDLGRDSSRYATTLTPLRWNSSFWVASCMDEFALTPHMPNTPIHGEGFVSEALPP